MKSIFGRDTWRGIRLLGQVISGIIVAPRKSRPALQRALASILDEQFDRDSPLPELAPQYLESIYGQEVTLPPQRLMLPGNQNLHGLFFLVSLARGIDARVIFEIGTYNGLTAWCLARNLTSSRIHTLDLPATESPTLPLFKGDPGNRISFAEHVYDILPHEGQVVQEWGDSAKFDFSPWYGRTDLVYVDGAHSKAYVASDTERAMQMVSSTGAIVWDDYWRRVPDVAAILDKTYWLGIERVPQTRLVVYLTPGARERLRAQLDDSSREDARSP